MASPPLLRAGRTGTQLRRTAGTGLPHDRLRTIGKYPGRHNRELKMKKLSFAIGVLALGFVATTPARADFAVIKFESGYCRIWWDSSMKPYGSGWTVVAQGLPDWNAAWGALNAAIAKKTCL
jgi:hypothetical protein